MLVGVFCSSQPDADWFIDWLTDWPSSYYENASSLLYSQIILQLHSADSHLVNKQHVTIYSTVCSLLSDNHQWALFALYCTVTLRNLFLVFLAIRRLTSSYTYKHSQHRVSKYHYKRSSSINTTKTSTHIAKATSRLMAAEAHSCCSAVTTQTQHWAQFSKLKPNNLYTGGSLGHVTNNVKYGNSNLISKMPSGPDLV